MAATAAEALDAAAFRTEAKAELEGPHGNTALVELVEALVRCKDANAAVQLLKATAGNVFQLAERVDVLGRRALREVWGSRAGMEAAGTSGNSGPVAGQVRQCATRKSH